MDWSIVHDRRNVKIILPFGQEERIPLAGYKKEVFRFADKVEAFYQACTPKEVPDDEFDRNGYLAFWNEWHRRRSENG